MLKHTPLIAEHRRQGARLVDFAGWEMPLHYGSQLDEHHSVRRAAGMFDVSHMLAIDLVGRDAPAFVGSLLANDLGKVTSGGAIYSCMLREDGGVLDDVIAYRFDEPKVRLVVNAATAVRDVEWITVQRDRLYPQVQVAPRHDCAIVAVQGPLAREQVWTVRTDWRKATETLARFRAAMVDDALVARTGYTGEDGFEVVLPAAAAGALWQALAQAGVRPCGLGARDTLRLEAGMNLYGQDMDETVTPFEAGLGWTVALAGARDFIGRAALERRQRRFELRGLALRHRGVLRAHQRIRAPGGSGVVTSGGFAPTLGHSIALAQLPPGLQPGACVEVEIRERWLQAVVVNYPFVRYGKSLLPD